MTEADQKRNPAVQVIYKSQEASLENGPSAWFHKAALKHKWYGSYGWDYVRISRLY